MKKFLAVLLAVSLIFGFGASVGAEKPTDDGYTVMGDPKPGG